MEQEKRGSDIRGSISRSTKAGGGRGARGVGWNGSNISGSAKDVRGV
jgi:hypothetical protein